MSLRGRRRGAAFWGREEMAHRLLKVLVESAKSGFLHCRTMSMVHGPGRREVVVPHEDC